MVSAILTIAAPVPCDVVGDIVVSVLQCTLALTMCITQSLTLPVPTASLSSLKIV